MATTPKKKPSASKSKIVASKKKGLSKKQWTLIGIATALVLAVGGYFGIQYYQDTTANAASCVSNTYKKGSSETCVKYIQRMLNGISSTYAGSNNNEATITGTMLATDGAFGSQTEAKVKTFQKWTYNSVDGKVGKQTWNGLCIYAGQMSFAYLPTSSKDTKQQQKNDAWRAAKSAGCKVEVDKDKPHI